MGVTLYISAFFIPKVVVVNQIIALKNWEDQITGQSFVKPVFSELDDF